MRITDLNINLTKCSKMTEESRIYGMNGATDGGNSVVVKEECRQHHKSDGYAQRGGRLKFFKNGKFILELARAKEGEKIAWVPVPKKTFWPPQGNAPTTLSSYRQESSASLSVSDDNSSIQSSPWQRDHTWKQATPKRNVSGQLSTFCYRGRGSGSLHCLSRHLRRRPYADLAFERTKCGNKCNRCVAVSKGEGRRRRKLSTVVQALWNRSLQAVGNATSPRKRILRELERVTIDDLSYKRCRGKVAAPEVGNGTTASSTVAAPAKNCSYSITSLLSVKAEPGRSDDDKLSSQSSAYQVQQHAHRAQQQQPPPPSYAPPYHYLSSVAYATYYGGGGYGRAVPYMPPLSVPLPRPNGSVCPSWPSTYERPVIRDDSISDVPLNLSKHAD